MHTQNPVSDAIEHKSYPCFVLCCFASPLRMTAQIPFGEYVAGETINLTLKVDNHSNQRVSQIKMELIQVSVFKSKFKFDSDRIFNLTIDLS